MKVTALLLLSALGTAILSTTARGGSALYNGLYTTLKEMTRLDRGDSDMRRRALVVLFDGDDTSSLVSFDDGMELARQSAISIYTIMLNAAMTGDLAELRS